MYYKVAVEAPLPEPLTYLPLDQHHRGQSVEVPLGKRLVKAVVVGETSSAGKYALKTIRGVDAHRPTLNENHLRWLEWLARYYQHPLGQVTALAFPPLKYKEPKVQEAERSPPQRPPKLTEEQQKVLAEMDGPEGFSTHLIFGVTGSGKTEVYLQLLEKTLAVGKSGIVLVPEIALTPQLVKRFDARFPGLVAVLHSQLTEREKTDQWWDVVQGRKPILVGARSALFCPIPNLGIIVVDEEHDGSYKQDEKLKYNGRDSAIMLAKFWGCPAVLGSATPSLESWWNAQSGKYQLHRMIRRVEDRYLPKIEIVDMRLEKPHRCPERPFWMSRRLEEELKACLARGEQAALFLNRRGIAQTVVCPDCGTVEECPNCAISLTLHGRSHLLCHYCDYTAPLSEFCRKCSLGTLEPLGLGTERLEADVKKLFPFARVARADRDEIQTRKDLEWLIEAMENRRIDILVGTQMIAKGLDFPSLTMVGLVLADVGLSMPDFRSAERGFQLVSQVAGRSGRHIEDPGTVVVQTYNTEHPSLRFAQQHDFEGFASEELSGRKALFYPPFSKLALLRVSSLKQKDAQGACSDLARLGKDHLRRNSQCGLSFLGPSPAPIARLRNRYRYHLLIKAPSPLELQVLSEIFRRYKAPSGTKVQIDIDPINML